MLVLITSNSYSLWADIFILQSEPSVVAFNRNPAQTSPICVEIEQRRFPALRRVRTRILNETRPNRTLFGTARIKASAF
jgi:hypothetical protein